MRGIVTTITLVVVLTLLVPTGVAPPSSAERGLTQACEEAASPRPCEHLRIIPTTTVAPGETRRYENGTWSVTGTVTVQPGGSVFVGNATLRFTEESGGIVVAGGGELRIVESTLEPKDEAATAYVLDLAPLSSFTLNDSTLRGGHGVKLATSDANVSGNLLTEIPLALLMDDVVEVTIHHNHFLDNNVSVNQTGGVTTLDSNRFEGGEFCVRDWLADPTIINNVFRGCHVGIWHERSNSVFRMNDMDDQAHEPGVGIAVVDTNSPVIESNLITNYGTGILIHNATAYIRNNTISANVLDGIRVEANTQPMDIQGNTISANGRDGIRLIGAHDVELANNTMSGNGGSGVRVEGGHALRFSDDSALGNAAHGFLFASTLVNASRIAAAGNALHGVYVTGSAAHSIEDANASANGYDGFRVATDDGATVTLLRPIAIANAMDGVRGMNGTSANLGWFEANGGAGVANTGSATLQAVCAYWGSASGPTHVDNPNGTGDEVEGDVDYTPFRTAPAAGCSTAPVLIAEDTFVS